MHALVFCWHCWYSVHCLCSLISGLCQPDKLFKAFLAGRRADRLIEENPLPNLGVWFELEGDEPEQEEVVRPYHTGEIIYFETSSDMKMLGAIPRNISHTIVVQHEELLFRYSSDNLQVGLQDRYQLQKNDLLFRFAPDI